jgi:hypothetical protein
VNLKANFLAEKMPDNLSGALRAKDLDWPFMPPNRLFKDLNPSVFG